MSKLQELKLRKELAAQRLAVSELNLKNQVAKLRTSVPANIAMALVGRSVLGPFGALLPVAQNAAKPLISKIASFFKKKPKEPISPSDLS